ncbi:hypothetical protein H696_02145 [Fonticula alba]|uniref:Transcription factor CBF/NF-Y/archaeal histone domain-containing protein n=1 Tax=Fonticula alba TaxID=691883 RepID=A0A058ZB95_FONAL|nr:hypothetical protein H696_02145 [Fonticula alba]KCV71193.1 hypothetical protein H696_02145 [Fonticula alba]|eukprot:XP_009494316.1 hypothetical protein H696_02145 [Fonticula alba]
MVQEMLPDDVTCARDAYDVLMSCCIEFVHLLAAEANEICEAEQKRTILPEHIVAALKRLEFGEEFLKPVEEAFPEHKKDAKERTTERRNQREKSVVTDEMLRQQQALLDKAREKFFN